MKVHAFLWVILLSGFLYADQAEYLFEQGVEAYQQGDYGRAIEQFESVLQHGKESVALYYNLGNAYFKTGAIGKSILNYERAHTLSPHDDDISYNLQIARLRVVDKIAGPESDFFYRLWITVKSTFSIHLLSIVTPLIFGFMILLFILYLLIKTRLIRATLKWTLIPVTVTLVLFAALFAVQLNADIHDEYGIIITEKVSITSAPYETSTEVFALHEGVKVKIIDRSGDYVRLRLTDGKDGWAPADAVALI